MSYNKRLPKAWEAIEKNKNDISLKANKSDIVNNWLGGVDKMLSAEQGKVLKQLIDTLGSGGATRLMRNAEMLGEYDYLGSLPAGGSNIAVGTRLFNPELFLNGIRIEKNKFSVDLNTGLITLTTPYSPDYDVIWVVEDEMPFHISFCFPTLGLLLADETMKARIKINNVIKILGESDADDGGHYLVKCEATSKLNGVDIGGGRFLNEIPNTRMSTKIDKTGGTFTGNVHIDNGKVLVTSNNYGIMGQKKDGTNKYILLVDTADRCSLGWANEIPIILASTTITDYNSQPVFTGTNCPRSLSQNGYAKFANGLIIQWGKSRITTANASNTIYYPIAFTSGNVALSTCNGWEAGPYGVNAFVQMHTGSSTYCQASSPTAGMYFHWIAMGY